jgi:Protein of unknown function (DUF2933)
MKALLPLLFVLVCPLMMVFMMRGMHGASCGEQSWKGRVAGFVGCPSDARAVSRDFAKECAVIDALGLRGAAARGAGAGAW